MRRILLLSCLLLLAVNVAGAEIPYAIDDDTTNGYVYFPINISAGGENIYHISKPAGRFPDPGAVFIIYDNYEDDLSQWDAFSSDGSSVSIVDGKLRCYTEQSFSEYAYVRSKTALTGEYIIEAKIRSSHSDSNVGVYGSMGIGFPYFISGNGVMLRDYGSDNTDVDLLQKTGSTGTQGSHTTAGSVSTSYQTYTLVSKTTGYEGHISQTATDSRAIESDNKIMIGVSVSDITAPDHSFAFYTDWVRARKYASLVPSVTAIDKGDYYEIHVHNGGSELTDYQVGVPCADVSISSSTDSLLIQEITNPTIDITLSSPADNSCVNSDTLTYSISGIGDFNTMIYVDDIGVWNGSVATGENQISVNLSEGLHTWYVNGSATVDANTTYNNSETWQFTYDTIDPSAVAHVTPDKDNVANGTVVQTKILWSDANLKEADFYVDTGTGYSLVDSTTFDSSDWFNTSINTTDLVGSVISWKQVATDEAGNTYTYSDSFNVIESELNIYVYDESTGDAILPESVTIYNADMSKEATITEETKVASLSYDGFETGKYIVMATAEGYYPGRGTVLVDITSLTELNIYLPAMNETVIYEKFTLTDKFYTYAESDCILRLDKPLPNGTDTVFSSYFDFNGVANTYLIAADQYILYIETPDKTVSYGWLTPDPDGEIQIKLQEVEIDGLYEDWLNLEAIFDNDTRIISLEYESEKNLNTIDFRILKDGSEIYTASSHTDAGSFNYVVVQDGAYMVELDITRIDGETYSNSWVHRYGHPTAVSILPENTPQWFQNIVVVAICIIALLGFGSYRADVGCILSMGIAGLSYTFGWLETSSLAMSVGILITLAAVMNFHRKEESMG